MGAGPSPRSVSAQTKILKFYLVREDTNHGVFCYYELTITVDQPTTIC
jgi:hypothetical protein